LWKIATGEMGIFVRKKPIIWDGWRQYQRRKILVMMVDITMRVGRLEVRQHE